jgi:glycosyltransferase involved in cell wall biosynthesis
MFKVIVVGWQAEDYIKRCLESILTQTEKVQIQVVLDPGEDKTYEQAKGYECDILKVSLNENRLYALENIINGIRLLNCEDEDVVVTVDADDWLSSDMSLSTVKRYYDNRPDLLLTYGSWMGYPNPTCSTNCSSYKEEEFKLGIRHFNWRGTHLRTFKYKVWKFVEERDLKDINGKFFKVAWDMAMMWPMLEMAGYHRALFISEPLYVYNMETLFNDFKLRFKEQMFYSDYIAAMKPYSYRENFNA